MEQEKKLNRTSNILLILAILILIFGAGYRLGELRAKQKAVENANSGITQNVISNSQPNQYGIDLSLFWNVWQNLKTKYVDQKKLKTEDMLYGAIKGMVASVGDPYTYFLTPKENQASKADLGGIYEGIGAQLGMQNNNIVIVAPLKKSPAEKAGIKSEDIILAINGESTKGMALTQAVSKIRGPKNTSVKLTLYRAGKDSFDLELKRQSIKIDSVELGYKSEDSCKKDCPKIAYLKLTQFGDSTNSEWDRAVEKIQDKWQKNEIKGMVLDLRGNPGGYLESAVYLASEFVPLNKLIVRQEYASKDGKNYLATRAGKLQNIPLVVLIDQGSASAAEILSGALRDYNRAKLVGQKSFGKGSVQEAMDIGLGAGLHVTVAKWILPNGDWINGKGIEPAIKIENKVKEGNTLTDKTDAQLQRAFSEVLK